jgi:hypothetical protein
VGAHKVGAQIKWRSYGISKWKVGKLESRKGKGKEVFLTNWPTKLHAETEFEKYRIVQDRLFMSDYDRFLLELEEQTNKRNQKIHRRDYV